MEQNLSAQDFINKFIIKDIKPIVNKRPYLAFILLSASIEFLGKCLNKANDWQQPGNSEYDFCHAIQTFASFKKYKNAFGKSTKVKNHNDVCQNSLYKELRCAMVHAMQPSSKIRLTKDRNDLANHIIGCKELFEDVVAACKEIKSMTISKNVTVSINGDITGTTSTSIVRQQSYPNK